MTARIAVLSVSYVVAAIAIAACTGGDKIGSTGTVTFNVTAVNAGASAKARPVPRVTDSQPLAVAAHTLDPNSPVEQSLSGPPDELIVTIQRIVVEGPMGAKLLFGQENGSGPGVDLHLTSGTLDLAAAGLTLNPIPTGHYTRVDVWVSGLVKMRGCLSGTFAAQTAVTGTFNGQTYTTDTVAAGTHQFCTIASKSLLNIPAGPVGTDAEYEAQTTGELTEFNIGAGAFPTSTEDARGVTIGIPMPGTEFDVDADTPTQLTLVVDMNRMLRFWPNIFPIFQPPRPSGLLPGTSYFFNLDFERALAIFAGAPGSIEGYEVTSELCVNNFLHPANCMVGSPPNTVAKEWLTIVRDPRGAVLAGEIAADDAYAVLYGDVVPTGVVTDAAAGTVTLPIGLYRTTVETNGTIDGMRFQSLGDPEASCTATAIQGGAAPGLGPVPFWYTRRL